LQNARERRAEREINRGGCAHLPFSLGLGFQTQLGPYMTARDMQGAAIGKTP